MRKSNKIKIQSKKKRKNLILLTGLCPQTDGGTKSHSHHLNQHPSQSQKLKKRRIETST